MPPLQSLLPHIYALAKRVMFTSLKFILPPSELAPSRYYMNYLPYDQLSRGFPKRKWIFGQIPRLPRTTISTLRWPIRNLLLLFPLTMPQDVVWESLRILLRFFLCRSLFPASVFGLLLGDYIDILLENVTVVAVSLIVGGIFLVFVDKMFAETDKNQEVGYK